MNNTYMIESRKYIDHGIGASTDTYRTETIEAPSAQLAVDAYFNKYPKRFADVSFELEVYEERPVDLAMYRTEARLLAYEIDGQIKEHEKQIAEINEKINKLVRSKYE